MKVSAKSGINIKNLFNEMIKQYLDKEFNILINNEYSKQGKNVKLKKGKKKKEKCCGWLISKNDTKIFYFILIYIVISLNNQRYLKKFYNKNF